MNIGEIYRIENPLQKKHGIEFEIWDLNMIKILMNIIMFHLN